MNLSGLEGGVDGVEGGGGMAEASNVSLVTQHCSDPEYYNSLYGLIGTLFQVSPLLTLSMSTMCNVT